VAHVGRVGVVRCVLRRVEGGVVAASETVLLWASVEGGGGVGGSGGVVAVGLR